MRREAKTLRSLELNLSKRIREIAEASADPLVKLAPTELIEFGYYKVIGETYEWKYLPDDEFSRMASKLDVFATNRLLVSHLIRVIEAFEFVSIWRAADLLSGAVQCLNRGCCISASSAARSLLELSTSYLHAQNILRTSFAEFPWDKLKTRVLLLDEVGADGRRTGLEIFVERLMAGTRLESVVKSNPDVSQNSILTVIQKIDRGLAKAGAGYAIRPKYDFLCEIAHPNTIGFQRFSKCEVRRPDGWVTRWMSEHEQGPAEQIVVEHCLWAMSFGAGTMNRSFAEFQKMKRGIGDKFGRPLP